jgi:cyclic-di-AMP phosphodiesterase PgpH
MSREDSRLTSRTEALARSVHARKRAINQQALGIPGLWRVLEALTQPSIGLGLIIVGVFVFVASWLAIWSRHQPMVEVGRVMDTTRLVRVEQVVIKDEVQTEIQRERARQNVSRVYAADDALLESLVAAIQNFPSAVAGTRSLEEISPEIVSQFGLTPEMLSFLVDRFQQQSELDRWARNTAELAYQLRQRPVVDAATFQRNQLEGTHSSIRLVSIAPDLSFGPLPMYRLGGGTYEVLRSDLVNLSNVQMLERSMDTVVREAGFTQPAREVVVARLKAANRPTYTYDAAATAQAQADAADTVSPVMLRSPRGEVIFRRGDVLSSDQHDFYATELAAFAKDRPWLARTLDITSRTLAVAGITAAMAGYAMLFAPRIRRTAMRVLGAAVLILTALAISCFGAAAAPAFILPFTVLPTLLVAMLFCIGYDRRTALAFGLLHGLLTCVALSASVATLAMCVTGVACVAASLREVRDRKSLVRTTFVASVGLIFAVFVFGVIGRPVDVQPLRVLRELAIDAGLIASGALVVGGLTYFMLPLIERVFGVTTGLTLTELRDPKQPLLRELQLRAPGTYTHSLNVATIAEAAAESIGADSLLAYVGCLYHDVGKMNKPEYFVENQALGVNKHDKLSPAMSLLLVVGHVKDGVELAREFQLPAKLIHFIEAHHGTTLVEYFYHRAKRQALEALAREDDEPGETLMPDEFAYRYPGPKPRIKEVAILMIADACESACRTMAEPSPAKIESLVQDIAHKRLHDGQFDDCELTLRELHAIVQSVSRTITSMYHGRVPYPTGRREDIRPTPEPKPLTAAR